MALRKDNDFFRLAVIVLLSPHSHVGWCIEMVWINSIILGQKIQGVNENNLQNILHIQMTHFFPVHTG